MVVWDLRWFQNRPFVEIGIWTNFARGTLESWALESGIQLKESGISLTIGIQNPGSNDKYWNPAPVIRNPRCPVIHWFRSEGVNH